MASEVQVLGGWMRAFARDGWRGADAGGAAVLADVDSAAAAAMLPDRWSALAAFGRHLDRAALAETPERDASVRDQLFALLMARFDAAEDHRAGVRAVADAAWRDPGLAAYLWASLSLSTARIARAAGVATGGMAGAIRVEALAALVLQVSRTWADDGDDLSATMKALDVALERAERWAARLPG